MTDKPSDIILTITVSPLANSKRQVLVSGAPEKELPTGRIIMRSNGRSTPM